jgi:sugar lactone lactonase YvrE
MVCAGAFMLIASNTQAQNLFVSDTGSGKIYEYTPDGVRTTFASGLATAGLAFNSAGDLFVADNDSGNIYEFTPGGVRTIFATGLSNLCDMAFNSAGDLFVGTVDDNGSIGSIYEYTPDGVQSFFASVGSAFPEGMAFNSAGNMFIGTIGHGIVEITPGGGVQQTGFLGDARPFGLAFNSTGNLFVADGASGTIYEFTPDGVRTTFATFSSAVGDGARALAFNRAGDLFVAGNSNSGYYIYEFTPTGVQSTFASGLSFPQELAFQGQTLPLPAPPQLRITPSGTNVILTWPTNATGFTLESTMNLASPAVWSTNSPTPVVVSGQCVVTNLISGTQKFYRLSQ